MRTNSQRAAASNLSIAANRCKANRHSICRKPVVFALMPPTARINAAIRDCLDALEPGRPPLDHLATFLERLREERNFKASEIREVETTVRRILSNLIAEEPLN
jgi:hypothetical protein